MTQERNEYICQQCQQICVKGDPSIIRAVGKIYHKQCFQCNFCHISVLDKFYTLDNNIVCEKDYYSTVQFNCHQCKDQIVNDHFELIGENKYHKHCLHCPDCIIKQQDDLERFEYDGKPYCRFHYSLLKGTACVGCGQAILYHYKYKHGVKWHPECYMIKKYWDIELSLFHSVSYKNKEHLISVQDELLKMRERIWNTTSQFQDSISITLSNIVQYYQLFDFQKEYELCHNLLQHIFTLFHLLDDQSTYLSCEDPVQNTSNDTILFLDVLCQSDSLNDMENVLKIANRLSNHTSDLLKLSLQQAIILEREENAIMDSMLNKISNPDLTEREFKSLCIQDHVQLIQMAVVRLGFVLKSRTHKDETLSSSNIKRTSFLSPMTQEDNNSLDKIKRALTTTTQRRKNRQKYYSIQPSTKQLQYQIPSFLPELTQQQDNTIRHLSLLYLNNIDESIMEELLDYKRDSLWGKLKIHINSNASTPESTMALENNKKIIGVSLSNLSSGSLSQNSSISSASFEKWVSFCPSVQACFSSNALIPNFLRDCILVIIDQDMNTEGLFRKNGNIRGIKDICETINSSPNREDWIDFFKEQPIIQLAAFLKKFLRELPEPLLTRRLYKLFLLSNRATHAQESVAMIHYTLCLLPKQNRDILFMILALLNWVAKHSSKNKMDYENLARVIAPTILYQEPDASDCYGEIYVISLMIEHYERLIMVPAKLTDLLKNSRLSDYVQDHAIDLTSTKQFIRNYRQLLKIKRDLSNSILLSPTSTKYHSPILSS